MKGFLLVIGILAIHLSHSQRMYEWRERDTIRFTPDSSYSRAMVIQGTRLFFGTSKSGVIAVDERSGATRTIIPPTAGGEFRAVEVSGNKVFGMTSGDTALLFMAQDGSVKTLCRQPGVFFDDLILDERKLFVLGDPVDGYFFIGSVSTQGIDTLMKLASPQSKENEACYAASATTMIHNKDELQFISGGSAVRIHRAAFPYSNWISTDLPVKKGEGAGPFSIHYLDAKNGVIVGGDYTNPKSADSCALWTTNGGMTWNLAESMPRGYRSCVTGNSKVLFCCGTTGIDYSTDGGKNWFAFDSGNFCAVVLRKNKMYATTNKGYCVRYKLRSFRVKN